MNRILALALMALGLGCSPVVAQQAASRDDTGFEAEAAILDTAIPFAIGAREARQELRGAFGWSTFQEGQVRGTYYRFDPDGYARFSSSPRLDADVFEVICRPRTVTCMARKDALSMMLTTTGQLQLAFDDYVEGDQFFLADGLEELALSARILQPLDSRLETLLGSGQELVIRRGDRETRRISLGGFYAVAAYLRWIAAGQDYGVLPRDWPVPGAARVDPPRAAWRQPGQWSTTGPAAGPFPAAPRSAGPADATPQASDPSVEVAEVRGELRALRDLLLAREGAAGDAPSRRDPVPDGPMEDGTSRWAELRQPSRQPAPIPAARLEPAAPARGDEPVQRVAQIEAALESLREQLRALKQGEGTMAAAPVADTGGRPSTGPAQYPEQTPADLSGRPTSPPIGANGASASGPTTPSPEGAQAVGAEAETDPNRGAKPRSDSRQLAERLHFLISEIGLDPKTALLLVELGNRGDPESGSADDGAAGGQGAGLVAYREAVFADILRELKKDAETPQEEARQEAQGEDTGDAADGTTAATAPQVDAEDYQLLSAYFRTVMSVAPDMTAGN